MRIALLTLAVPWTDRPTNGLYNIQQARALIEQGHHTEIFSIAPRVPRIGRVPGSAARRQANRPAIYARNDVTIRTVRTLGAYPAVVRRSLAPRIPRAVADLFRRAVAGPLTDALLQFRPDALVVHGMMPWGDVAASIAGRLGVPCAVIEHSADDVARVEASASLAGYYRERARSMTRILCVSRAMADTLRRVGVDATEVLRNGVTTLDDDAPEDTSREDRPFSILCAGQYHERKGHAVLIEAFARASLGNAVLRLVGKPPRSIHARLRRLGIADRVEVLPPMTNRDLLREMARADLFAMPSWSEAFGLVFMEALGAGTPVLMTSDCGAAEHVRHGRHAWVIEPRDITAAALALEGAAKAGPERRREMGRQGRQLVRGQFTWRANAEIARPHPLAAPFPERTARLGVEPPAV